MPSPGRSSTSCAAGRRPTSWFPIYYGSIDATPLFLVLLSEVWRWTGDAAIVKELEPAARAALAWIDDYGDRDGDGFVEYERRAPHGLANQSWKDSGDSQRFRDGQARRDARSRPPRCRATSYDARIRAAELADHVWDDPDLAIRLRESAARPPRPVRRGVLGRGSSRRTRSRSTATSSGSTRSARTSATCSGRASCPRAGSTRSPPHSQARSSGPAGACARWARRRRRTTRSATTTAPSGRTTRRSPRGVSSAPATPISPSCSASA